MPRYHQTRPTVMVNANLVEHSPAAVGTFLDELKQPFVIDPMRYRFDRTACTRIIAMVGHLNERNYTHPGRSAAGVDGLTGDPLADRGHCGRRDGARCPQRLRERH